MNSRSNPLLRLWRAPVSRILSGSAVGQAAVLAVSPVLTRLYSPEDFAALAVVTSVSAVLGGVVTLSWERAIVVPADGVVAKRLLLLATISTLGSLATLTPIFYVTRHFAAEALNSSVFLSYWWLTPVTVSTIAAFSIVSAWIVRQQAYGQLALRNGIQGVGQAVSSVALGFIGIVPLGLLLSTSIGRLAGLIGLATKLTPTRGGRSSPPGNLRGVIKEFWRFPVINTWSRLINAVGLHFPIVILVAMYGSIEVGIFALTTRVLASPIGVIVNASSQWFEGVFASKVRDFSPDLGASLSSFVRRMFVVGIGPALALAVFGPAVFELAFGGEWRDSGVFAQLIVVGYLAQFCVAPASRALVILGWQGSQLAWDLSRAGLVLGAILVCGHLGLPLSWCIGAMGIAQLISYVGLFALCKRAADSRDRESQATEPPQV